MTIRQEEYEQIIEDLQQKLSTPIYDILAAADKIEASNTRLDAELLNLSVLNLLGGLTLVQKAITNKSILSNGNISLNLNYFLFEIERFNKKDEKYENAVLECLSDLAAQLEMHPFSIGKHIGKMYDFETRYEEYYILLDNEFKEVAKIFRYGAES